MCSLVAARVVFTPAVTPMTLRVRATAMNCRMASTAMTPACAKASMHADAMMGRPMSVIT